MNYNIFIKNMKIKIITGLTCSGKSNIVKNCLNNFPDINLINIDIL